MKIKCPKCDAACRADISKIPREGIHARCPGCQARFFFKKKPLKKKGHQICRHCEQPIATAGTAHVHEGDAICHDCHEKLTHSVVESSLHITDIPAVPESVSEQRKPQQMEREAEPTHCSSPPGPMNFLLNIFSKSMAIDLGTANTLIYIKGKGIVLDEPSVVALHTGKHGRTRVLAVGADAKKMLGRVPQNIAAIRPMRDGVITDFEVVGAMLRHFIGKARSNCMLMPRTKIVIAVPYSITSVEKRAVRTSAQQAGAGEVFLIEEPMAAAIGAGLTVRSPTCNMVVDIGGGTTDIAAISLAGIVSGKSLRIAGDKMDAAIIRHIKKKYNFIIGDKTAENIKIGIGNACPDQKNPEAMEIKGWDLILEKPRILSVHAGEIRKAIGEHIRAIAQAVKIVLDSTPQELTADIVERGIILTGGVALLKNLDKFLEQETGLPIKVAGNPLTTVAEGSGKTLEDADILSRITI